MIKISCSSVSFNLILYTLFPRSNMSRRTITPKNNQSMATSCCESITNIIIAVLVWLVTSIISAILMMIIVTAYFLFVKYILEKNPDARCAITSIVGVISCPERHSPIMWMNPSSSCTWYTNLRHYCPVENWKLFGV